MKLIALMSGGIDSPVAVERMIAQGAEVICVHFANQTPDKLGVEHKVARLCQQIADKTGKEIKFYLVPFAETQREIIKSVPATHRMVIYRRFMLKIAERILEKEGAEAFVTGDNLGQVASQTLENLNAVYSVTGRTILTPLLGNDKEETIKIAKKIGTFEISTLPYEDCCSLFIAKHPVTKARRERVEAYDNKVSDQDKLISEALNNAQEKTFIPQTQ